ncbi:hypothetical protein M4D50_01115 [Rothia sp. p3-SID1597]|nr:hypothetical protein [Rothia sp. p3-SID1597]
MSTNRIATALNNAEDHLHAAEHSNQTGMVNEMESHLELATAWVMFAETVHNTTIDDIEEEAGGEEDLSFENLTRNLGFDRDGGTA